MKKGLISKLHNISPKKLLRIAANKLGFFQSRFFHDDKRKLILRELRQRFEFYRTPNLTGISTRDFVQYIQSQIGKIDEQSEGYSKKELDRQRDLSIKFHWGHNHDFGEFSLEGKMGDRHIELLANFTTLFEVSLKDFEKKDVFDIGCWTGGTTLLLASLGSKVYAIEEVNKYADVATFLAESFGVEDRVTVNTMSLYDCNSKEFHERFDIVYFPGVIYHLSDPLIALRILFNSLRLNGIILVESAGINQVEPLCRFAGSLIHGKGTKERLDRSGWNWFVPSPSALFRMMREAGFEENKTLWHHATKRVYGYGRKVSQVAICKAGLSVPNIE
jgi:2-polyprenyl-3-methyl-5-hydroxy-6-metoxy-1,4-benzoquinol methylase